jgi:hypothetical protein
MFAKKIGFCEKFVKPNIFVSTLRMIPLGTCVCNRKRIPNCTCMKFKQSSSQIICNMNADVTATWEVIISVTAERAILSLSPLSPYTNIRRSHQYGIWLLLTIALTLILNFVGILFLLNCSYCKTCKIKEKRVYTS